MNRRLARILVTVCILLILPLIYYGWGFPFTELLDPAEPGKLAERAYSQELLARGEMPLWNPYFYSGHPHMACLQPAAFYPPNFLYMVFSVPIASNLILLLHYSAAGIFTFFFCVTIGFSIEASIFSAISFMFCGYLTARRPFPDIMNPSVWLPLMLLLSHKILERPRFGYASLAALVFCIQIFGGHTQPALYTVFVCMAYVSYFSFKRYGGRKRWLPPLVFAAAIGMGIFLAAVQLLPLQQVSALSVKRGVDYREFTKYSFHPLLLPLLLYPFLLGADFPSLYEGWYQGPGNLVELSAYTGILPLCFAMIAVIALLRKEAQVRFWGIIAAIALFLVFGGHNPLYRVMWYVPIYNMFRAPARNWYEFDFAIAILAGFGLGQAMEGGRSQRRTAMLVAGMLFGVVAVSVCMLTYWERHGGALLGALSGRVPPGVYQMLQTIAMKSNAVFIPMMLMAASLCVMLLIAFGVKRRIVLASLFALLFIDLLSCGSFYWRYGRSGSAMLDEARAHFGPLLRFIGDRETDPNGFRICSLMRSEYDMLDCYPVIDRFGPYRSINGFGMMLSRDYASMTGMDLWGTTREGLFRNNRVLSMLGAKYIIARSSEGPFLLGIRGPAGRNLYRELLRDGEMALFENVNAGPRVWCAERVIPVGGFDEARALVWTMEGGPDLAREAVVEGTPALQGRGAARIISEDSGRVEVRCESPGGCFLVLADRYFPGWHASVGGARVRLFRTNGILRGVAVPPGGHIVAFEYRPRPLVVGAWVSVATAVGMFASGIAEYIIRRGRSARAAQNRCG